MNTKNKLELIKALERSSEELNKAALTTILDAYRAAREQGGVAAIDLMGVAPEFDGGEVVGLSLWLPEGEGSLKRRINKANAHRYLKIALQAIETELDKALDIMIERLQTAITIKD